MALSDRDRRSLIILGIVAGVAIIAFVLFNLLAGGGGGESAAPPTGTTGPTAPYSPSVSPTPTPRETLPPVYGERDPFSIPPDLQATPSGSVSPTSSVSPSQSLSASPSQSPSASPSQSPSRSPHPGSSITIGGYHLTLLDIFAGGQKAQVDVDEETVWTLEKGSTFPRSGVFKLIDIRDQACARFTYGDKGFTLCL